MSQVATTAYIGIGSNLGDRSGYIDQALAALAAVAGVKITALSSIMETAPQGGPSGQGNYLNGAVEISCHLTAQDLLGQLQSIEKQLGRTRGEKWAARTIDLDLLLFGSAIIDQTVPDLQVPHPLMHKRLFVMVPMAQIAPEVIHPRLNLTMKQIKDSLEQNG
jgi:2-amino-4-hydroxy-6-hydroxymethyldihydropteridine diphosphokinase